MINGFKITKYWLVAFCMVYSFTSALYAQEKDKSVINEFNGVGNRDILSRIAPIESIIPIDSIPIDPVDPINIPSINCNLLPSTVDGSFQSCVSVAQGLYNSNITCGGWRNVEPTSPDTWNIPIISSTYLNNNMIASPDGGSFAGGVARFHDMSNPGVPEAFSTTITNLIPGVQYQIKFYQSNMTNFNTTNIMGSVRWKVTFGNEIQTSGNAIVQQSPTWSEQSLTFTATTAIQNLLFTAVEGTIIGNYDYLYAVIDGIKIIRTNFDCNAPCTPIVGKIKIVSTPTPIATKFYFEGRWNETEPNGSDCKNAWVEYLDSSGKTIKQQLLPIQDGCQEIVASKIINYGNTAAYCTPVVSIPICNEYEISGGENGRTVTFINCSGESQTVVMPPHDSAPFCSRTVIGGAILLGSCSSIPR